MVWSGFWESDEGLMGAIDALRTLANCQPMPLKEGAMAQTKAGRHPVRIPTMHDRAVQTLYALALMPVAECTADARSYAYRPYKSAHDAVAYLRLVLCSRYAKRWVLDGRIEDVFGTLSHEWLLTHIPMDCKVLEKFLKAGFLTPPNQVVYDAPMGALQGGLIAPILVNMALDGLEHVLSDGFRVVRYGDKVVVVGKTPEDLTSRALPAIRGFLAERGLRFGPRKANLIAIEDGFDFLGFTFREYANQRRAVGLKKGVFLVTPAKAKVQRFKKRLKSILKPLQHGSPARVIVRLNPVMRAWAQYYKAFNAKKVFASVRSYVWWLTWLWCRKKHPKMTPRVLRWKHFKRVEGNTWVFHARTTLNRPVTLVQLAYTPIEYHTLCKDLNPFLPASKAYYLRRQKVGASRCASLNPSRSTLLKKQHGVCPVCDAGLLHGEPLEVHPIHPRARGGKDTWKNLLLLHRFCHKQVTYSKNDRLKAAWRKAGIVDEGSLVPKRSP